MAQPTLSAASNVHAGSFSEVGGWRGRHRAACGQNIWNEGSCCVCCTHHTPRSPTPHTPVCKVLTQQLVFKGLLGGSCRQVLGVPCCGRLRRWSALGAAMPQAASWSAQNGTNNLFGASPFPHTHTAAMTPPCAYNGATAKSAPHMAILCHS